MRPRLGVIALLALVGLGIGAQQLLVYGEDAPGESTGESKKGPAPRTAWGTPDFRGVWNGTTITPLERPATQEKEFLTEAEAKAIETQAAARNQTDAPPPAGDPGTYNQVWFDPGSRVLPNRRTSLITDPKDGRIPFTPEGREHFRASNAHYGKGARGVWTDFDTGERCLTDGIPVYFTGYNNNYQIFQNEQYVVIVAEMFGDRRIIPLDNRERPSIPQWLGASRGRWDGDALVVETANFADKAHYWWAGAWRASRPALKLTERFTRVDAETISYEFTVTDPQMFTQPWTATFPLSTNQAANGVTTGRLYEYACHEGNYALPNTMKAWLAQ